jgi:ribosomal-protein-alanine N-acetyltransferase
MTSQARLLIETARLRLRPARESDVDALHALWTDPKVRRFLWDDRVIDRATAAERVSASLASFETAGWGLWVVEERDGPGELLGHAGLIELDPALGPELIYAFHPSVWGRGYAGEASRAVLAHAFGVLGFARMPGRTDTPNRESARVLERLGMRFEGEHLAHGRPTLSFAITREEFERSPEEPR